MRYCSHDHFSTGTLLLFFCISCSGGRAPSGLASGEAETANTFYAAALENIERGEFEAALSLVDSSIQYKPGFALSHQVRGWVLERLEQPDSAIAAYQRCLEYRSSFPEVWKRLGRLTLNRNRFEEADTYLRKAVRAYPDSSELLLDLARANFYRGRHQLVSDHLRNYRRQFTTPHNPYFKWLGMNQYKLGELQSAAENLSQYLESNPEDVVALKHLGFALFDSKAYDRAISFLNQAAQYDKQDPEIYLYRARYFFQAGKPGFGWEQLDYALAFDAENLALLHEMTILKYQHQEYESAQFYADQIVALDPTFWKVYRYLGLLAEQKEQLTDARRYYQVYLDNTFEADDEVEQRLNTISEKLGK